MYYSGTAAKHLSILINFLPVYRFNLKLTPPGREAQPLPPGRAMLGSGLGVCNRDISLTAAA